MIGDPAFPISSSFTELVLHLNNVNMWICFRHKLHTAWYLRTSGLVNENHWYSALWVDSHLEFWFESQIASEHWPHTKTAWKVTAVKPTLMSSVTCWIPLSPELSPHQHSNTFDWFLKCLFFHRNIICCGVMAAHFKRNLSFVCCMKEVS